MGRGTNIRCHVLVSTHHPLSHAYTITMLAWRQEAGPKLSAQCQLAHVIAASLSHPACSCPSASTLAPSLPKVTPFPTVALPCQGQLMEM